MSGKKLLFNTAPKIRIRLGDKSIAYAIGFNVSVNIGLSPVSAVGYYGPVAIEPTLYNVVTGTLQIMKVVPAGPQKELAKKAVHLGFDKGNNLSNTETTDDYSITKSGLGYKDLNRHLDPAQVLASESFDLDLYLRAPVTKTPATKTKPAVMEMGERLWLKMVDARLGSRSISISMGQLVGEPISFQALLLTPTAGDESEKLAFSQDMRADQTQG